MERVSFPIQIILVALALAVGMTAQDTYVVVVSAASFRGEAVAPESIAAAFGQYLAVGTEMTSTRPLPTALLGTRLRLVDSAGTERFAPLYFVSPNQINFLVPAGTATGLARMTIITGAGHIIPGRMQVEKVSPGPFAANSSGQGVAAALAQRIAENGQRSPLPVFRFDSGQRQAVPVAIDLGRPGDRVVLSLFGTGLRSLEPRSTVTVEIGEEPAQLLSAGPQEEFIGLDQVNVVIPPQLRGRGDVPVVLTVDGSRSNAVTICIR
jgi:uncharacterized protein (TIGR03437 family)